MGFFDPSALSLPSPAAFEVPSIVGKGVGAGTSREGVGAGTSRAPYECVFTSEDGGLFIAAQGW